MGTVNLGVLARIIKSKKVEVASLKAPARQAELMRAAAESPPPRDFLAALANAEGPAIIAELKRRSPSAGDLAPGVDAGQRALLYQHAGASAMSVLTDGPFFGGSLSDLALAKSSSALPVLRKDFLIHPVQLYESTAAGADAVLLIAEALPGARLGEMYALAQELLLTPLVELHGEDQLERVLSLNPSLVGVNNRDLVTLKVDPEHCLRLRSRIPRHILVVAESGISRPVEIARLSLAGLNAFLIGSHFMQSADPAAALALLLGREAA